MSLWYFVSQKWDIGADHSPLRRGPQDAEQAASTWMLALRPRQDLVVRPALASDVGRLGRVRTASWQTAYRSILPPAELDRLDAARATRRFRDVVNAGRTQSLLVVHRPGQPAFGYAWGGPQKDRSLGFAGEVYELYLHPAEQGQGGGRQLLSAMLWRLAERTLWPAVIWVLADNPARHFYEACGGRQVLAGTVTVAGKRLPRIGFSWDNFLPLPAV